MHYFNGELCSNPYHLATFFYESAWCFLVFLFLWSYRKKFKHDGDAFFTYAFLYGFERMFVEGLRGDSLYLIQPGELFAQGIRVSQLGSFVAVVIIGIFFLVRRAKEKKLGRLIWPAPEVAEAPAEAAEQPGTGTRGRGSYGRAGGSGVLYPGSRPGRREAEGSRAPANGGGPSAS